MFVKHKASKVQLMFYPVIFDYKINILLSKDVFSSHYDSGSVMRVGKSIPLGRHGVNHHAALSFFEIRTMTTILEIWSYRIQEKKISIRQNRVILVTKI